MKKTLWITVSCLMAIMIIVFAMLLFLNTNPTAPQSLGSIRVNLQTYLAGQNQPTHPSVVVFPEQWNGGKYWLAYSPYPYGNGEEENPCLAISNDLLYWETPAGLANPIADNEETGCNELKDPHLLYRDDLNRLEMWYLGRLANDLGGDGTSLLLLRKCSDDGINWSDYEVMASTQYLSPTVFWDGAKYQMWSIGYDLWNTKGTFVYQESTDGIAWSEPLPCHIGAQADNIDIWHGTVTKHKGEYHFVFVDESDKQEIFYCKSSDGNHFSEPEVIVENEGFWNFLYRPTLVFDNEDVFCLYGVVNSANQWYLSMSSGPDVNNLLGIRQSDVAKMAALTDSPINTHSLHYKFKTLYNTVQNYLRLELIALVLFEVLLAVLFKKVRAQKYLYLCFVVNFLVSFFYIIVRFCPASLLSWIGTVIAVCCLNFGMAAVLQCAVLFCRKQK